MDEDSSSESEDEVVKETGIDCFSKGGLLTDQSGSIRVRIEVMENYFNDQSAAAFQPDFADSQQHRVKMRETVDETLKRVRSNKRWRMAKAYNTDTTANPARSKHSTEAKSNEETKYDVASRTTEVLQRVRARKQNGGQERHEDARVYIFPSIK